MKITKLILKDHKTNDFEINQINMSLHMLPSKMFLGQENVIMSKFTYLAIYKFFILSKHVCFSKYLCLLFIFFTFFFSSFKLRHYDIIMYNTTNSEVHFYCYLGNDLADRIWPSGRRHEEEAF